MGLLLPGAIAAHRVHPRRRILAITGDGDFLMNLQEMETARQLGANITVMVWVGGGYGLICWKQQSDFGRSTELSFGNPDSPKLADSFGWHGQYVDSSRELAPALQVALDHEGLSLLALPIDYRENLKLGDRLGQLEQTL